MFASLSVLYSRDRIMTPKTDLTVYAAKYGNLQIEVRQRKVV